MALVGAKCPDVLQRDMRAEPVKESQAFQIDPGRFREWFANPDGDFVMPGLPQRIREVLGTEATSLVFSAETLAKQKAKHPEILADDYVRIINRLHERWETFPTKDRHVGLIIRDERMWAAIIKETVDGRNAYLVSLYGLRDKSLQQFLNRFRPD